MPLIEIVDPPDGGAGLRDAVTAAFSDPSRRAPDWIVATSRHGARRLVDALTPAAREALGSGRTRTATVGTATAEVFAAGTGRAIDLVPPVQRATAMLDAFARRAAGASWSILVAQADRAEPTLVEGLRSQGHEVQAVTAYVTGLRTPSASEIRAALSADVVAFASGSAAEAWARTVGTDVPAAVVAIGPTTARVARAHDLPVTAVAVDHSVPGLADAVVAVLATRS